MTLAVGLDIGNQRCVVAVSRNGVVDGILNEDSKRETPAVIQFADRHRLFGSAAASTADSSVSQLKRLVCRDGKKRGHSAVQLLAMLLAHVRRSAEATTRSSLSDCVIGIPSYFDERQRTAYLNAARVAGWNPLALLDEGAAIALEYINDKPECAYAVAFVDVGHSDTQISVVSFDRAGNNSISVVAKAFDPDLGGRDFDKVIFDHFSRKFEEEHGMVVRSNTKATARLMMACEKAKKVLSTNREAHLSVDSLIEDRDAKGVITRREFEILSSGLVSRIGDLVSKALEDARLQRGYSVHSVELVGSGSRIPAISTRLAEIYRQETSRTLNGSESVARGCALLCERLNSDQGNQSTMMESFGIPSSEYTLPSIVSDLSELEDVESKLAKEDREYESAGSSRNKLEAFVYEERNKWSKDVKRNMSKSREVLDVLEKREEWLYEEGEDRSEDVYNGILEELKRLISRYEEKIHEDDHIQHKEGTSIENPNDYSSNQENHLLSDSDPRKTGSEVQKEHDQNATSQPPAKQRRCCCCCSKFKDFLGNLTAKMNGGGRRQEKMINNQVDDMSAANGDGVIIPREIKSRSVAFVYHQIKRTRLKHICMLMPFSSSFHFSTEAQPRSFFRKEGSRQEGDPRNASSRYLFCWFDLSILFQKPKKLRQKPYMSPHLTPPQPHHESKNSPSKEPHSSSTLVSRAVCGLLPSTYLHRAPPRSSRSCPLPVTTSEASPQPSSTAVGASQMP